MRILIIKDDGTIRSILSHVLSQNGHEVPACMFLREVAGVLADKSFDLIISD